MEAVPFERVLGGDVGRAMMGVHEAKGVRFLMQATVARYLVTNGRVSGVAVKLADGVREIPASVVVLGVGIVPATELLTPQLPRHADGSVSTDEWLQASDGLFVGGDIARFPLRHGGEVNEVRVEHWAMAQEHGRVAACNMLRAHSRSASAVVPFFWTSQYTKSLRYAGYSTDHDQVVIRGDLSITDASKLRFAAFYVRRSIVLAVATFNLDPLCAAAADCFKLCHDRPITLQFMGEWFAQHGISSVHAKI